jgi:xanthine dehydrogenase accessory factor
MQNILDTLETALQSGQAVAYTALVETRGSTPQKAGAAMLVFPDGSQAGTLGGGCVEAEVKRRALKLLDEGQREILSFQLDSDYGWDDGLICGGRMTMLVDPISPQEDHAYFQKLREFSHGGQGCTEAIVFDPEAAYPPEENPGVAGERYLLDREGSVIAMRASYLPPAALGENLRSLADRPRPYVKQGISYLPQLQRCRLVIVGAGHVGQKVAELAADSDFDVWVIDDRESYCNQERFPKAKRLIVNPIDRALKNLEVDPDTFCIIVTRGHNHDEEALLHLAETKARYVGLIGSKRKIKLIFEDLLAEGISREALEKVHAPLGFDIGSQTVPEIAISIVAELIACRNLGNQPLALERPSLLSERP